MGEVLHLRDAMSRELSRSLGVSIAFVEACRAHGVSVDAAKALFAWFFALPLGERVIVVRSVVRDLRAKGRHR